MTGQPIRKTAVITGGGTGIGLATARHLLALGWQVVIHEPGLGLAVPMGSQVRLRRLRNGRGVVIGDLFSKLADAPAPVQARAGVSDRFCSTRPVSRALD